MENVKNSKFQDFKLVKEHIVNLSLSTGAVLAIIAGTFMIIRSFDYGFSWSHVYQMCLVVYIALLGFSRRRLSLNFKVYSIIFVICSTIIAGLFKFGFLISTKVFIVFIPIYAVFLISNKRVLLISLAMVFIYLAIGLLYVFDVLEYDFDTNTYVKSLPIWIMDSIHLIGLACATYFMGKYFSDATISNYKILNERNIDLSDREEKYRVLFESSNDAIFLMERNSFYDCNEKTLDLLECKREEIIGKNFFQYKEDGKPFPEENIEQLKKRMILASSGDKQVFRTRFLRQNGDVAFHASISLNAVILDNRKYVQAVVRDMSRQVEYELKLKKHQSELEQIVDDRTREVHEAYTKLQTTNTRLTLQKRELEDTVKRLELMQDQLIENEKLASVGMLAAGVAHEINNPMNFIQGGLAVLQDQINLGEIQVTDQTKKLLSGMNMGVNRIVSIINALNQFNRNSEVPNEQCDIHQIIDNCLAILHNNLKRKVTIQKSLTNQEFRVMGNEGKLHQVILNLIANAEQAIEDEGQISISTEIDDTDVTICIEDTGSGIPQEIISKIKEPFFTTKDPGKGTGLGLSISNNIVTEHGGTLDLYSNNKTGTKVILTLPLNLSHVSAV
ncbi:PAS domain-containing sensor histidine kinase [Reichenbachiella versicolor]|uniref:PAS domain-containing sensor histidine kinase n=1 Tax=Reichenbachiella versicolor TaxID=1821036 RepID=UPI000D6DDA31|nr:ATP-binding protein [Reichenbachiella versicolor]